MARVMNFAVELAETGRLPDAVVRLGIRHLIGRRLREENARAAERYAELLEELRASPIALAPDVANEQHYEVPPAFFRLTLGPRLKYSACYWGEGVRTLADAETAMLELTLTRAGIEDGMRVLDLGCGWGAFTLFAAARLPRSEFLAVSNSRAQQAHIAEQAQALGLANVKTHRADVNSLALDGGFDRVVCVEMFEHVRNHAALLERISRWLAPAGRLFVHIFCHQRLMYPFETSGDGDWMGRSFFTGGLMPARDTLHNFQDHLAIRRTWQLSGAHYRRTARAWLANLDAHRHAAADALGADGDSRLLGRWRLFFMACEELFGWNGGREWLVCHYLFEQRRHPRE